LGKLGHQVKKQNEEIFKLKKELDLSSKGMGDLISQNQFILQTLHHHRFIKMDDNLKLHIIPNEKENIQCIYFNVEKRECQCKVSPHLNKFCSFSFWFADCIQFRGEKGELPELYKLYNKKPGDIGGKKKIAQNKK